jgi:hypothetical protein
MNLDVFRRIVRPMRECPLEAAPDLSTEEPVLLYGDGEEGVREFERVAPLVGWGSAVVLTGIAEEQWSRAHAIAERNVFRDWFRGKDVPGLPAEARTWVKSEYDGKTYSTHLPYLLEAVRRTAGPVLELGAGESSTPSLHKECAKNKRVLLTVDNSDEWLSRFDQLWFSEHRCYRVDDPAEVLLWNDGWWKNRSFGVVFVDHSPGETRGKAIDRSRDRAEYIVVHDTEDLGYGVEELLSTFKYRKDFRRARPWTTVVSTTKEIW